MYTVKRGGVVVGSLMSGLLGLAAITSNGTGVAVVRSAASCPASTVTESSSGAAGGVCVPQQGIDSYAETAANMAQLSARTTAPSSHEAPNAYLSAIRQSNALPVVGGSWSPVGNTPECAQQTSLSSTCPAPSSANGGYAQVGTLGFRQLSGRVSSFASDPASASHLFASPVAGGVFETTDSGITWRSVGDGLATQLVGAIAYDAPLHELIVGTGDNSFGGDGIAGHGIYLSTNDGGTWTQASGVPDLALSFRIVVSPVDTSGKTVYAALSKGLFRSTDGGASFTNLNLPTTPTGYSPNCAGNTSDNRCFFANIVTDVVVKGTTTTNGTAGSVIAVVGWRAGTKADAGTGCLQGSTPVACLQSPQNGIYRSTDGITFTWQPEGAGPATTHGFAPDQVVGRTALGIASGAGQSSDAVYALVEDAQKFNGCLDFVDGLDQACNATAAAEAQRTVLDGAYASYDFGASWTKIMDFTQLFQPGTNSALTAEQGYGPGVQGWYNLWVQPDPTATDSSGKPSRLLFGLEEIWENNQALETVAANPLTLPYAAQAVDNWEVIGRYWNACAGVSVSTPLFCNPAANNSGSLLPGSTTHPDQHAAILVPDATGGGVTLWAGSDGGVYKQHVAAATDFSNANWGDGLDVGINSQQAYDAEMSADGTVISGLQDNGEMKIAPGGAMAEVFGGDAFFNTIDPGNSNNMLEEYTYGATSSSTDGGSTWTNVASSDCSSSTALFSTPIEQDPTTPGHVVVGCNPVDETSNAYGSSVTWNSDYTIPAAAGGATSIPSAVGVRGSNIYIGYCGYCDVVTGGLPFASGVATNVGGSGWHVAQDTCTGCGTANGLLPERYITSIQIDPSDPNTVYATLGGYGRRWVAPGALGDSTTNVGNGHVFKSTDHGDHWTDITGNLPDVPADWTLIHSGQLVVATDIGVYVAPTTAGGTWSVVGTNLPNAPVFTIRPDPANADIILAGTYGRGDWTFNLANSAVTPEAPIALLLPLTALGTVGVGLLARRRRRASVAY